MEYSPVIIPTLNRKEHLERCLNSLANNTYAKNTDIFISVDFPPNKNYENGCEEIKKYLETFDKSQFNSVKIYYQANNLGVMENYYFLKNEVKNTYSTYIYTEDDNEFSENFLEYINKGLILYKDDMKIMAICGFRDSDWKSSENIALTKLFSAYGFGTWFDKEDFFLADIKKQLLSKETLKFRNIYELFKNNKALFTIYIRNILLNNKGLFWDNNELVICDTTRSIYMHLTNTACIAPEKAKSRTWGNDGSGVNMPKNDKIDPKIKWKLDEEKHFEFSFLNLEFDKTNYVIGDKYLRYKGITKSIFLAIIGYIFLKIFLCDRSKVLEFIRK